MSNVYKKAEDDMNEYLLRNNIPNYIDWEPITPEDILEKDELNNNKEAIYRDFKEK